MQTSQDLPYHGRVDGAFLPIAIRQNRIEDVLALFLRHLAPPSEPLATASDGESKAEFLVAQMRRHAQYFRLPSREDDLALIKQWIRNEILVESRATNRLSEDPASVVPVHLAVGQSFIPRSNPPDYGALLAALLSVDAVGSPDWTLLESLQAFFSDAGDDVVARLLQGTLWQASDRSPRYRGVDASRMVAAKTHAATFQTTLRSVLAYRETVGRRTFVNWLFALVDFFLATYVLRMAHSAEYFATRIEEIISGSDPVEELKQWDHIDFQPILVYGRENPEHPRLLKRFPSFTSTLLLIRALCGHVLERPPPGTFDLAAFESHVRDLSGHPDLQDLLRALSEGYPTKESDLGRRWKLTNEDKKRILERARSVETPPLIVLSQMLNFEDMARSSNNVREWQFYATLARDKSFGFARMSRGDYLFYELTPNALSAFLHCYVTTEVPATLSGLVDYLQSFGFAFDGLGRGRLESQLIEHGLLEPLADAGEAKILRPMYRWEAALA